ncbi:MAG: hypothetical protein Q27BB25_06515 [Blastomonas sp. CACIA14H2]|nr:MAG: hypothetical protein Q27BB25_06515 [Blastomonas sp. CACIA14H2]
MRKGSFFEEHIMRIIKEQDSGLPVVVVSHKHGHSATTILN